MASTVWGASGIWAVSQKEAARSGLAHPKKIGLYSTVKKKLAKKQKSLIISIGSAVRDIISKRSKKKYGGTTK